jgi:K+-transporting ATPase KdpF subunit
MCGLASGLNRERKMPGNILLLGISVLLLAYLLAALLWPEKF